MISLDAFLPRVLPYVPACSEPLARQALIDSAIDFCDSSMAVRQTLDSFTTVAGTQVYDIDPPTSSHLITRVLSVTVGGESLQGVFEEDAHTLSTTSSGSPTGFYTSRTDSQLVLHLYPTPDDVKEVIVHVALRPTKDATTVDDDLYNRWADAVVDGALCRIMKVPGQPFSDLNYAMVMRASANQKIHEARSESYYGRVRGATRIRPRPLV